MSSMLGRLGFFYLVGLVLDCRFASSGGTILLPTHATPEQQLNIRCNHDAHYFVYEGVGSHPRRQADRRQRVRCMDRRGRARVLLVCAPPSLANVLLERFVAHGIV
jgi:hypothetical protein